MNPFYHDNVNENKDIVIKNMANENISKLTNSMMNEYINELANSISTLSFNIDEIEPQNNGVKNWSDITNENNYTNPAKMPIILQNPKNNLWN